MDETNFTKAPAYSEIFKVEIGNEVFIGTCPTTDVNGRRQGCNDVVREWMNVAKVYAKNKELIEALAQHGSSVEVSLLEIGKDMRETHQKYYHHSKLATIPNNALEHIVKALEERERKSSYTTQMEAIKHHPPI